MECVHNLHVLSLLILKCLGKMLCGFMVYFGKISVVRLYIFFVDAVVLITCSAENVLKYTDVLGF